MRIAKAPVLLSSAVIAFIAFALPVPVLALQSEASYPVKSARWIVSFPAGVSNDLVARTIGQKLSDSLGQQFVVDTIH